MDDKQIEELKKKRDELTNRIKKAQALKESQERKQDTRKKILMGAMLQDMTNKGVLDKTQVKSWLNNYLVRDIDRKLFNLGEKSSINDSTSEIS